MQQHYCSDPSDILVVDDDPVIVEMLTELLVFEGYSVRGAHTGLEALDAILVRRPALILLDLQMPCMTGAELIDALAQTNFADLPIIIITATPVEAQRIALDSNVACMAKPLDLDALFAGIAEAMHASLSPGERGRGEQLDPAENRVQALQRGHFTSWGVKVLKRSE